MTGSLSALQHFPCRLPIVLSLLLFSLVACAGPKGPEPTINLAHLTATPDGQERNPSVQEINARLQIFIQDQGPEPDYTLTPGDLIQIKIFEAPQLNTDTRISANGGITLPLLGKVDVAGMTLRDAEQRIEHLYQAKYIQEPHVTLFVTEQHSLKITLLGALNKPGAYDYYASMNLMDVLALGEGLRDNAGNVVQIKRKLKGDATTQTLMVDMDLMIRKGHDELNIPIKGGDILYVPEAGTVYVDGAVRKAGTYPIRHDMSLQEAIVAAGGLSSLADSKDIKLIRYLDDGKREVAAISLENMRSGEAATLKVRDRDVIFVEYSATNSLFQALRLNIGTGSLGLGFIPTER